jgi:hypothetical protein
MRSLIKNRGQGFRVEGLKGSEVQGSAPPPAVEAVRGGAHMKLHKIRCRFKKYLTAEIAENAENI